MSQAKRMLGLIKDYKGALVGAFITTVLLTLLNLPMPFIMRFFIDEVITKKRWELLNPVFLALIGLFLLRSIVSYFNTIRVTLVGQRIVRDLRLRLYKKLHELSISFFDKTKTGTIISRMMDDVAIVQNMITGGTIQLLTDFITLIVVTGILLKMNWKMTIITFVFLPLYAANFKYFIGKIREMSFATREKMDEILGTLQERITGAQVVKTFVKEKHETRAFTSDIRESLNLNMKTVLFGAGFGSTAALLSGIGSSTVFCYGMWEVIRGNMTIGDVMAFAGLTGYLFGPITRFANVSSMVQRAATSIARIFEILEKTPDVVDDPSLPALPRVRGHVKFENVSFWYEEGKPVLVDINLEVLPGQKVAFVGHTGCGKTTLINLLLRFYNPTKGRILIDGYDISSVNMKSLREQIGVVLQDVVLFNDTVRENIRYGKSDATDEEIIEAAKIAEIHDTIERLPQGYDTILGEGGVKLSLGERQRIAIARAVIKDPAIIVLDEATSSLDSESETLIQKALKHALAGRTSLIIAHRLSTIVNADLIIVMDKGRIVEMGTHQELMSRKDGFYRKLYETQFGLANEGVV